MDLRTEVGRFSRSRVCRKRSVPPGKPQGPRLQKLARLCRAVAGLGCKDALLDGEIVSLGDDGKAHFNSLLFRRRDPVFYAFDVLWLNGRDLRQRTADSA